MLTHTLGFPRIGLRRELKKALEGFWNGTKSESELNAAAADLRKRHWKLQHGNGIDLIPVGDFSFYDHVLDTSVMLGAIPERFGWTSGPPDLNLYFRMARGATDCPAMEMSKWFDTNYHYIVPEFRPTQSFALSSVQLVDQTKEAIAAGFNAKPVILGPITYLRLGKATDTEHDPLTHLDSVMPIYEQILSQLAQHAAWIQIDEPALILDLAKKEKLAARLTLERLIRAASPARVMLATYFGPLLENLEIACVPGLGALHVDLTSAPEEFESVMEQLPVESAISLGIVNGRNVWRTDAEQALRKIEAAKRTLGQNRVMLGTSCSLLHSPIDLDNERGLDDELHSWLAFAKQKCQELRVLADAASGSAAGTNALEQNRAAMISRQNSARSRNPNTRFRVEALGANASHRKTTHSARKRCQQERLKLPQLPTTTIGSFPQTPELRATRQQLRRGAITLPEYENVMRDYIRVSVDHQHALGLDVLVHGEPERNDMVEYFGEQLDGFCFTQNGWVQSYGSRCVKPPIIFGDVSRSAPMTVKWSSYAQSLTAKPMKGMLTGPVTILCWSFVRDDLPRREVCRQIALAIRDEVLDLEAAGIQVIQVDEAALREGLPLRRRDWDNYLDWAVEAFRIVTSGVKDETQIHTHMCYSDFNEIIEWIARMDADVISIEASRSRMELMQAFRQYRYPNDIGPGVYDIHSPRIPSANEIANMLRTALDLIPPDRLWVNPDCGLKTRRWPETLEALRNMVDAARLIRTERGVSGTGIRHNEIGKL